MNGSHHAMRALALASLFIPLSGARAGEMGPTSRGSVSISITIPPHIVTGQAAVGADPRTGLSAANGLCIAAGGEHVYRVALLGAGQEPTATVEPSQILDLAKCAATGRSQAAAPDAGEPARAGTGPIALLVIPD